MTIEVNENKGNQQLETKQVSARTDIAVKKSGRVSKRVNIRRVASEAGVSVSSVSHAFSGRRRISEPVRKRIFEVARELGYYPHRAAQSLARQKTMTIGVLIADMLDQWAPSIIHATEEYAKAIGYRLLLGLVEDNEEEAFDFVNNCIHGMADGIILNTYAGGEKLVKYILEHGYPVTTVLAEGSLYDSIRGTVIQHESCFRRLLEYLYSLGHREFGVLWYRGGYSTVMSFFEEKNIEITPDRIVMNVRKLEEAEAGAETLLKRCPEVTVVVCYNDVIAIGALRAATELGIKVPDSLSVVGRGGIRLSWLCSPALTTLQYPIAEMARESVRRLVNAINKGPELPVRVFPVELVTRDSSAPPPHRNTV